VYSSHVDVSELINVIDESNCLRDQFILKMEIGSRFQNDVNLNIRLFEIFSCLLWIYVTLLGMRGYFISHQVETFGLC
jgi:hypothetical protein